jgi:hypothetical protein
VLYIVKVHGPSAWEMALNEPYKVFDYAENFDAADDGIFAVHSLYDDVPPPLKMNPQTNPLSRLSTKMSNTKSPSQWQCRKISRGR